MIGPSTVPRLPLLTDQRGKNPNFYNCMQAPRGVLCRMHTVVTEIVNENQKRC